MEERYDEYDELKERQFKMWEVERPQLPLTKEQYDNIKEPKAPEIDCNWFI